VERDAGNVGYLADAGPSLLGQLSFDMNRIGCLGVDLDLDHLPAHGRRPHAGDRVVLPVQVWDARIQRALAPAPCGDGEAAPF
jgi:hypothetical protein